ncbi:MAG TPA: alpha/beta hydrolase, partial [Pirellulales bacterium]|nr:alpha/beta hydrolase [Pirellulales bacterium]
RAPNDPTSPTDGFSGRRGTSVTCGQCQVWIPRTHHFGETGNPFWRRWRRLEFADDHLRIRETEILSDASFWGALQEQMKQANDGRPHGLVYLHGYNVGFHDAIIRGAQIGFDLRVSGATAIFSWPSQGTLKGYPADGAAVEASENAISHFLTDFTRRSGAAVIHVIAHSMGNRGLLRSLQRIAADAKLAAGVRFGQIFLAAPDVDRDLFLDLARLYPEFSNRTTLYASPMDRAVEISGWLHEAPRAGYLPPVTVVRGVDRFDTVEVPGFNLDAMGHGYFAEAEGVLYDMVDLMLHGTPPPRTRMDQDSTDGHWVMRL